MSVRAEVRFTKGADFVVAVADDDHAERVGKSMLDHGFVLHSLFERTDVPRIATMRFLLDHVFVDLLTGACAIEAEVIAESTVLTVFAGRQCPVASVGALLALKALACANRSKPDDAADMQRLLAVATSVDLATAYQLLAVMEKRTVPGWQRIGAIMANAVGFAQADSAT
ncbi:MAG: hypothetical protein EXR77_17180 [Myxococcales bacterium]|nr:hypothetical protein [Myxococcales bacterium]